MLDYIKLSRHHHLNQDCLLFPQQQTLDHQHPEASSEGLQGSATMISYIQEEFKVGL